MSLSTGGGLLVSYQSTSTGTSTTTSNDNTDERSSLLPSSTRHHSQHDDDDNNNNDDVDFDDNDNDVENENTEHEHNDALYGERGQRQKQRRSITRKLPTDPYTYTSSSSSSVSGWKIFGIVSCICLLVVFVALTCIFLYIQNEIHALEDEVMDEHRTIEQLTSLVQEQDTIIQRFNSTVSNSDVLQRVSVLEVRLDNTTTNIQNQLAMTEHSIQKQLQTTQIQLQQTVDAAEDTINQQVMSVKNDVEQYVLTTQDQFSMENSFLIYQLAGTFTVLSCLISMWHMTSHIRRLYQPNVQRKILAILWMSPVYAITSWFSLVFPTASGWLAIIKDGYEGYVIYTFLSFCIAVIGGNDGNRSTVVAVLADHATEHHLAPPYRLSSMLFPCCIKPERYDNTHALADAVLLQCQQFAIQFVFLRPLTTTAHVILKHYDCLLYKNTILWDYRSPQLYIILIQNVSIFLAFNGLLRFYHAVDIELAWCRPFAKFLCIKGVVFMTFWQGLAISILAQTTDFNPGVTGTSSGTTSTIEKEQQWAESAQNFLICLEMLLFSIAHFYCFPTEEWEDGYREKHLVKKKTNFGDTVALGDFVADLKLLMSSNNNNSKKSRRKASSSSLQSNIINPSSSTTAIMTTPSTIPEGDDESESTTTTCTTDLMRSVNSLDYNDEERGGGGRITIGVDAASFDDDDDDDYGTDRNKSLLVAKLQKSFDVLVQDDPTVADQILATARAAIGATTATPTTSGTKIRPQTSNTGSTIDSTSKNEIFRHQQRLLQQVDHRDGISTTKDVETNLNQFGVSDDIHNDDSIILPIQIPPSPPADPPPILPPVLTEPLLLPILLPPPPIDPPPILSDDIGTTSGDSANHAVLTNNVPVDSNESWSNSTSHQQLDDGSSFVEVITPSILNTDATKADLDRRSVH